MSTVSTNLQCLGCQATTKIPFARPKLFTPTMFEYQCSGCDSKWFTKVSVPRPKKGQQPIAAGNVVIEFRLVTPGAKLLRIMELRADAEIKKKPELLIVGAQP